MDWNFGSLKVEAHNSWEVGKHCEQVLLEIHSMSPPLFASINWYGWPSTSLDVHWWLSILWQPPSFKHMLCFSQWNFCILLLQLNMCCLIHIFFVHFQCLIEVYLEKPQTCEDSVRLNGVRNPTVTTNIMVCGPKYNLGSQWDILCLQLPWFKAEWRLIKCWAFK